MTHVVKKYGTKYGIDIVKPWSTEMYDHNDEVAKKMKTSIKQKVITAYAHDKDDKIHEFAKYICGCKFDKDSFTIDEVYDRCIVELITMDNFRLNDEYPDMVKEKLVTDQSQHMVGYNYKSLSNKPSYKIQPNQSILTTEQHENIRKGKIVTRY